MNLVEDKIVHLLTGKPNLGQVTVDELLAITDEQPFFSVAQLLLTQKMKQVNHPGFTHQLQKTALFFPNTFWLDQHLQAQPDAGYNQPAPAPVNTYTPPPAYTPAPAETPSYTPPPPVEAPKPASFESNPYAPPGYSAAAETGNTAPKQEQPWYNNPDFHKEPSFPAASTPATEVPATPAAPAPSVSINDAYAAYLPQQDVLAKVSGNTPPATPPATATPPAYTPDAGYTPASSYTPGASYTPESSYNPASSYTPGSSYTPEPSKAPESPYAPAASQTSDASYTPASSYTPGSSYTPESSYTPGASYTPSDSYNPAQSTPPAVTPAPEATEQSKTYEPWYTNPAYQQPAETPAPSQATPAASSVNDAYSAYLPQGFSAPSSTPAETPVPAQPSYTPPSSIDDYAPPPTIDRYTPSEQSYAPASSYSPADNSDYSQAPTMDRYAPAEPENRFTPPPVTPAPLPEPVAEQPKVYDPWYTNPIYQQPYQDTAESTQPAAEPETALPAPEAALTAEGSNVTEVTEVAPVSTIATPAVTETPAEAVAETAPTPEVTSAPESIEVIAQQEEPVAATAYPAPAEPVQEASPAVEPAVSVQEQAVAEPELPATQEQPQTSVEPVTPTYADAEQYGASGPYRLSRPPVIEVTDETSVAKPEAMNSVEPAEATSVALEAPVAETSFTETPGASTDQDYAAAGIVEVTSNSADNLPPLDDNTDGPEQPGAEESNFSPSRLSEMLSSSAASFKKPVDNAAKLPFGLEPYMIDYFASQGIDLEEVLEAASDDTLGKKVRKFTDWLRQMRRINPHPNDLGTDPGKEQEVKGIAALSIEAREILTESMADVLVKQGKHDKAIQLYSKLSFLNPAKTAYFASKIIETSKLSGK